MIILFYLFFFLAVYCWLRYFLTWPNRKAKRDLIYWEAKLEMEQCAAKLEKMLLNSDIVSGDPAHDILFRIVNSGRNMKYFFSFKHSLKLICFPRYRRKIAQRRIEIDSYVQNSSQDFQTYFDSFFQAATRAFCQKHRIIFYCILIFAVLRNVKMIYRILLTTNARKHCAYEKSISADMRGVQLAKFCS